MNLEVCGYRVGLGLGLGGKLKRKKSAAYVANERTAEHSQGQPHGTVSYKTVRSKNKSLTTLSSMQVRTPSLTMEMVTAATSK